SDCVSLWSGVAHQTVSSVDLMNQLKEGLLPVLDYAAKKNVLIGFEPEPGMVIDTMAAYAQLCEAIPHPQLRLTLDIGHLYCQGELPIEDQIRQWAPKLV